MSTARARTTRPGAPRPDAASPARGHRPEERRDTPGTVGVWMLWLAPIVVLPGVYERWGWGTLLLALAGVAASVWARPAGRLPRPLLIAIAAAAVVCVIAALLAADPVGALFGRAPRYEGVVVLPVLVAALWAGARLIGPAAPPTRFRAGGMAVSAAAGLLGLIALLEAFGLRPIETDLDRPGALAGNATDQGILGIVFAGLLVHLLWGTWRRAGVIVWWAVGGLAGALIAVVTSASRAAMLGAAVIAIAFAIRAVLEARRRGRASIIAAAVAVAGLLALLALPEVRGRLLATDDLAAQTIGDRLTIWGDAWRLVLAHPWTGVGPSGYMDAVTGGYGDDWYLTVTPDRVLNSPHNALLQLALAGGFPLLLLVLAAAVWAWVLGMRHARAAEGPRRDLLLAALAVVPAVGLALCFSPTSPKTLLPVAVLAGVLVAVAGSRVRSTLWRGLATAAIAVWAAWLAVCAVADAEVLRGVRAAFAGQIAEADAAFAAASALRPWDADVALIAAQSIGGVYKSGLAGASDVAWAWGSLAADRLPASAAAQEAAGVIALERGDTGTAVAALERAASRSPANPRIAHELGLARFASGDLDGARTALSRALDLAPDSDETRRALDDVCDRLGAGAC